MRRFFFLTCVVSCFTLSSIAQIYTIQFEKPQLEEVRDGYSLIVYENCLNMGREGTPEIPYYGAEYLLSPGHELKEVRILSATYYPTQTGIRIKPAVKPVPISRYTGETVTLRQDSVIYNSAEPYPAKMIDNASTHFLNGHSIGAFTVCPVVYEPVSEKVQFLRELTLEILSAPTDRAGESSALRRSSALIDKRINQIVRNPELLYTYTYANTRDDDPYDLLLISNNALMPAFEDYVEFKESTGFFVKTITTEEIYSTYTGQDNADKIRNCIKDYYQNNGISYVILGGDGDPASGTDNIIPPRGLDALDDSNIPSDMYYAGLDGNWNTDGDNYWGEPNEWDLYSEVSIGRICVDNVQEIQSFVNKLIKYQDTPVVADIEKALMVGEQLNSNTWGGTYKDEIANGSSANGYTTEGISPNFEVSKLYEMTSMWYKEDIFEQFNQEGVNLVNHLGHSNVTYNMKMYNSDLTTTNFTNDGITRGFVVGYSQGCYNGSFDNRDDGGGYGGTDCFAEVFTNLPTGEVATIANSRYGWYNPGGTNSSSQYYDREFYDAIFGEDITRVGDVNARSKEDDVSYIQNDEYCAWTAYELNLFGDPSMDIWTAIPTDITADIPVSISIGSSSITITTDAPYARVAVTANDELIGRGIADAQGDVIVEFPTLLDPAPLYVTITAHNRNKITGEVLVISNQPYLIFTSYMLNDNSGNDNGFIDFGENISMALTIKNVGDQPAYNSEVTISTDNEYVTLTDDHHAYGLIPAGESKTIADAFSFEVASNIPDQTLIEFDITIVADDTWEDEVELIARAPEFTTGAIFYNDSVGGNSSGSIDAGETLMVIIPLMNSGHSDGSNATASLSTGSVYATIENPNVEIESLPADTIIYLSFPVVIDDEAPIGAFVDLTINFACGDYTYLHTYNGTIGIVFENWETGDFSRFAWSSTSQFPWQVTPDSPYEGAFCIRSGTINNDESSNFKLSYTVLANDSISFFRKVSSEEDADYLQFFIDDNLIAQWAGMFDWERFSYPVNTGFHTFKWVYTKNYDEFKGLDRAWIDYIVFPPTLVTTCNPGPDTTICEGEDYQCQAAATNYYALEWETSGTGSFSAANILTPIYYPSQGDYNAGSVTLTLTAFSGLPCGDITRDLILSFMPVPDAPGTPAGPDYVDLYYTTTSDYAIQPVPGATSYNWLLEPPTAGYISGMDELGTVTWNTEFTGTAGISVAALNECGDSDHSEVLEVLVSNTVGIDQLNGQGFSLQIHPNPASDVVYITVYSDVEEQVDLTITHASGTRVLIMKDIIIHQKFCKELDISALPGGVYYIRITGENAHAEKKLILQ
ncbi:MAG TPA: C25 family cysteine peptidase [Bacteroidales bacterium]|nr:C25 family cysteine peptidase [Bacteroidales bacterium]HNS45626.1 C25 family cysteine peptidase [Bacteroidales bacterium]